MPRFYPLQVVSVEPETREAVTVTLQADPENQDKFHFTQGQYLTFRSEIDGEEVRRSYSICAPAQEQVLRVGIKQVEDGRFSTFANQQLKPGDSIEAMPPMGSFFTQLDSDQKKHYVAFVGGSGITPVLSIIKTTLRAEPESTFALFYGNRATASIMFKEELEDMKNAYLGRFQLVHVLEREAQDIELFNGLLDQEKCAALLKHWSDASSIDTAFLCGPEAMMLQASQALQDAGVDKSRIKFELFSTPGENRGQAPRREKQASTGKVCQATIVLDGHSRDINLGKDDQSILDAALEQGIEAPYACKGGVCSTCRALLTEGEVEMDANFALEDYEIQRGYILTCQSFPITDKVVVDYDK